MKTRILRRAIVAGVLATSGVIGITAEPRVGSRQQPIELYPGEAQHIQVDHRLVADARNLCGEQRLVPPGVQRNLVVGQTQGARLRG